MVKLGLGKEVICEEEKEILVTLAKLYKSHRMLGNKRQSSANQPDMSVMLHIPKLIRVLKTEKEK